jgi:hypothetical protein
MRTSWPENLDSVLALIPVSTMNGEKTPTSWYFYPILAEISLQRIPPLAVGGAQSSSIGLAKKETLALDDRPSRVATRRGSHPVMGLRHCSRTLGKVHGSKEKRKVWQETGITWFPEERPLHQTGILWLAMLLKPHRSLDDEPTQA